jgi:thiol-disulfide isomerase/thioredoxin
MKIIILISVLIFVAVGYFLYNTFYKIKTKFIENNEYKINLSKESNANIMLFYTTWCPHCKTTLTLWNSIKKQDKYKKIKITFLEIDLEIKVSSSVVINSINKSVIASIRKTLFYEAI